MGQWHRSDIERYRWLDCNSHADLALSRCKCTCIEPSNASMYFGLMRYDRLFATLDNDYDKRRCPYERQH